MKKTTRILLLLALVLTACLITAIAVSAASSVQETDWVEAPAKQLVRCPGGDCDHSDCDYVYSFAVVGDTQQLNYRDVGEETDNMKTLYRWILNHRESLNIQFVMGLGDITQSFNTSQERYAAEWPHAKEAIALLDEAMMPYSLVRGNHDISDGMNGAFGYGNAYYAMIESLAETGDGGFLGDYLDEEKGIFKVESTWRRITAGGRKYLIFALDYQPTEVSLDNACRLIGENPDCKVIVTLHEFLGRDGAIQDDKDSTFPYKQIGSASWGQIVTGGDVFPRTMWERLRKYENLEMILCGHVDVDDVICTQMRGENGNTVTCILTNGQTIDQTVEPCGLVTMLYFSADGNVAHVEYISTVREAEEKPAYLKQKNQYAIQLAYEDGWVETDYGYMPKEALAHPFHVFQDDDGLSETETVYVGSYDSWTDAALCVRTLYNYGSATVRKDKTFTILLTEDYDGTSMSQATNEMGKIPGTAELDLGGHTFTLGNVPLLRYYNNAGDVSYCPTFRTKNGTIAICGSGSPLILQTTVDKQTVNAEFSHVNFVYGAASKASVVSCYNGNSSRTGNVNLLFDECTFDLTAAGNAITLAALQDVNNNNHVTLTWRGGEIRAKDASSVTFYTVNEQGDTVLFAKGAEEEYPKLVLAGQTAVTGSYLAEDGVTLLSFGEPSADGALYVYRLAPNGSVVTPDDPEPSEEPERETPYGTIPDAYLSAEDYPALMFLDGQVIAACASDVGTTQTSWTTGFLEKARNRTGKVVVYLRRDVTVVNASFSNYSTVNDLLYDLGGHTLTAKAGVFITANKKSKNDSVIEVRNGSVLLAGSAQFLALSTGTANGYGYRYTLNFDRVNVAYASGATATALITNFGGSGSGVGQISYADLTFTDCRFDFLTNAPSKAVTFLNVANDNNNHIATIVFRGGSLAAKATGFTFASLGGADDPDAPDSMRFEKDADGGYFSLILPESASAPLDTYANEEGTVLYYAKGGTADGKTTYTLTEREDFGEWEQTKAPTCTEAGEETRVYLPDPTRIETRPIPATGHTPATAVEENRIEATETTEGSYDLVVYCSVCHEELSRQTKTIAPIVLPGSKGAIDVWLIAGQSNAAGYGSNPQGELLTDPRYKTGFDRVLYYGIGYKNVVLDGFVPVKLGQGKDSGASGAEIGIASVASAADGMSAVIKVGVGSAYLYPNTGHEISKEYGTWTSPSYIAAHQISTDGNQTGALYLTFLQTVKDGLDLLTAEGYTPVVKGVFWMQGEAETGTELYASSYRELLETLILDMRRDLGEIADTDLSDLPFVMGRITRNQEKNSDGEFVYTQPAYLSVVTAAQASAADSLHNVFVVDTTGLEQSDGWHYTANGQKYLGEQFVLTVISAEGKYGVTLRGENVTIRGGGEKAEGEEVTVVITPNAGCTILSVRYREGIAESVAISLESDGSFTFTMPAASVVFEVEAVDANAVTTEYGVLPSAYAVGEEYPFVLFRDGNFAGAYETWDQAAAAAVLLIQGPASAEKQVEILLRADASTNKITGVSFAFVGGKFVLDLGGHTLTSGEGQIFNALGKATNGLVHDSRFVIKNGRILMSHGPVVAFNNVSSEDYTSRKNFYFDFERVTFGLAEDHQTWHGLIVDCYDNGTIGCNGYITLRDCSIDLVSVEPIKALNIFDLNDISNKNNIRVTIIGGSFTVSDSFNSLVSLAVVNEPNDFGADSVVFAADGSRRYTEWISYAILKDQTFDAAEGEPVRLVGASAETPYRYTLEIVHTPSGSVEENRKEATCTTEGSYDLVVYCSVCGEELSRKTVTIPALGHTYGEWIAEIPATYESEGVLGHYHCSVCGKDFDAEKQELSSLVIPKLEAVVRLSGVKQNITLTTELRTNVFFPQGEKKVTKVLYGDVELPLLQRTLDGAVYDYVTVSVAAKDAAKEIALTVSFTFENESYEQTIQANLPQYASLLAKHEEGKYASLANAILYYVKCADSSAAFEAVREEAQKAAAVNSIDASSPIKGASIYLGSSPVWVISLDTGYTGKIRYSFAGRTYQKEVAKQESLALDEIRLSDLTETISFSYTDASGAFVEAGSYNLSAYAEAVSENASVSALVDALYDYSVAAHNYICGE